MGLGHSPSVVFDGLVYYNDAANKRCYSGTGLTSFSLVDNKTSVVTSGIGYSTDNLNSFWLDGNSNTSINTSSSSMLTGSSATLIMWLKLFTATPTDANKTGFCSLGTPTDVNNLYDHYPWLDGLAYLSVFRNSRVNSITLNSTVIRTNPHMVTVTNDGVNWRLYQNLNLVTTTGSVGVGVTVPATIYFGYSGSTIRINGNVYCFMLYNKALSYNEIVQNYNALAGRFSTSVGGGGGGLQGPQ